MRFAGRFAALILDAAQARLRQNEDDLPEATSVKLIANGVELPLTALLQTFDRDISDLVEQRAAGIVQGRFEERLAEIDVLLDDFVEKLGLKVHGDKFVMDMPEASGPAAFDLSANSAYSKGGSKTYG